MAPGSQVAPGGKTAPKGPNSAPKRRYWGTSRHRISYPLGIATVGLPVPLRSPPGWPRGVAWPPGLDRSVAEIRARWGAQRDWGPSRTPMWRLGYAAALALHRWPCRANILAGLRENLDIADQQGPNGARQCAYRAIALHNAAVLASTLPGRTMARFAAARISAATRGIVRDVGPELAPIVFAIRDRLVAGAYAEQLRWDHDFLVADRVVGRARIRALPAGPIEGAWAGIRDLLAEHGLAVPAGLPPWDPISLTRRGPRLLGAAV